MACKLTISQIVHYDQASKIIKDYMAERVKAATPEERPFLQPVSIAAMNIGQLIEALMQSEVTVKG